ncbi:Cytokine receptor-like factor 2 [Varanus komodoensis]|nr:Cytokine receptor-like factor 2 [Varanus komodoensis]
MRQQYEMGRSQWCCYTFLDHRVGTPVTGTIFDEEEWKQCPQYTLHQGYNSVCLLHTEGDRILISIRDTNGTKELYFSDQEKFMFFQPNPPEHVSFQWTDDEVTAKYNPPKFGQCLKLELQYKSKFDKDWQHRKCSGWEIKTQGFDPAICYSFRFRLEFICGVASTSEWGAESFWKNATALDSCAMDESKSNSSTVLILVMTGLLIIFIILLCVCSLQR